MGSAARLALAHASASKASLKAAGTKWVNHVAIQQPGPLSQQESDSSRQRLVSGEQTAGPGQLESALKLQPTASTEPCQHLSDLTHPLQEAESPDAKLTKLAQDAATPQAGQSDRQATPSHCTGLLGLKSRLKHVFDECFGPSSESDTVPRTSAQHDTSPEDAAELMAESPGPVQHSSAQAQQAAVLLASPAKTGQKSMPSAAGGGTTGTAAQKADADSHAASTPKVSTGAVSLGPDEGAIGSAVQKAATLSQEPTLPASAATSSSPSEASPSRPSLPGASPWQATAAEAKPSSAQALPALASMAKASPAQPLPARTTPVKLSSAKSLSTTKASSATASPAIAAVGKAPRQLQSPRHFGGSKLQRTEAGAPPKIKRVFMRIGKWAARSNGKHVSTSVFFSVSTATS